MTLSILIDEPAQIKSTKKELLDQMSRIEPWNGWFAITKYVLLPC